MSSFRGGCHTTFCIQSFPSPAHFVIGVSHITTLLWNPNLCFNLVAFAGSFFMLHALQFRHHVIVLHPTMRRSAFITGTSPSSEAQVIAFQTCSACFSPIFGSFIFVHLARIICADLILYSTQSCPANNLSLRVSLQILDSRWRFFVVLVTLQSQLTLPFKAVLET